MCQGALCRTELWKGDRMLGDREKFLKKYAVPEELFEQAGMDWEELCAIAEDYAYRVDGFYMIRDMFLKELIENREE